MHKMTFSQYAQRVYARCDALALHSQSQEGMDRRYLTTEHQMANAQVAQWMQATGMQTWTDAAGNQWGRLTSEIEDAPTLIMGSHIDTVPNGGIYDGILGVVLPISLVEYLVDNDINLPFHLDIVAFGDEEGTRFGTTLLGSRAIAGTWEENWKTLKDAQGVSLEEAIRRFGSDVNSIGTASRLQEKVLGFIETHIEQGPVLEAQDLPVGVVSGIAGANRFQITVKGSAGHAGTVPMNMRNDALVVASEMIAAVQEIAQETDVVATVGRIHCSPNAVNVIPGKVEFSIDVRSEIDARRETAVNILRQVLNKIAIRRNVDFKWQVTHGAKAVLCDSQLQHLLTEAVTASDFRPITLSSGAGHDAMAMANICPIAMLFVRCERGISHHPDEAITVDDVEATLKVLVNFMSIYRKEYQQDKTTIMSLPFVN